MSDKTYHLAELPNTMNNLTYEGANAIEENIAYWLSLLATFDADVGAGSIGSLGYLETGERGFAGVGLAVTNSRAVNKLTVTVQGSFLLPLRWGGSGWRQVRRDWTELVLTCDVPYPGDKTSVENALQPLWFSADSELDAAITFAAACDPDVVFDPIGPVGIHVRAGAVWALIDYLALTWDEVEDQSMTWRGFENLHKDD